MTPREVIRMVFEGKKPPYVPWQFSFTHEAHQKLVAHYGTHHLDPYLKPHFSSIDTWRLTDIGNDCVQDEFGVVWDHSQDKDIGVVKGCLLPEPSLRGFDFPDPLAHPLFRTIDADLAAASDRCTMFDIGFSFYERAWTLRGIENLYMDFVENPKFVHQLLGMIADHNIAMIREAVKHDIDVVHLGDDWGGQYGLLMGPKHWYEFIYPQLKRMYAAIHAGGKFVSIHSCGDVDELFDDLVGIGLNCFNPFQPEVMDVEALMPRYRGRLAFYGGLSTQRVLPYATPDNVRKASRHLLDLGRGGGYIFAPAHSVEGDAPLENMLAAIETATSQPCG